jgi:hypothetical protein
MPKPMKDPFESLRTKREAQETEGRQEQEDERLQENTTLEIEKYLVTVMQSERPMIERVLTQLMAAQYPEGRLVSPPDTTEPQGPQELAPGRRLPTWQIGHDYVVEDKDGPTHGHFDPQVSVSIDIHEHAQLVFQCTRHGQEQDRTEFCPLTETDLAKTLLKLHK